MNHPVIKILVVLLLACCVATATGEDSTPRAFKGSMSGEASFDFDFTSSPCLAVTGAPWQTISTLKGKMTHMGLTEYLSTHCSTLDGMQLLQGEAMMIAANGDELWLSYTAELISHDEFPPPPVELTYLATNVVVGGTGRFEGATGSMVQLAFISIEDLASPTSAVEMIFGGTVTY